MLNLTVPSQPQYTYRTVRPSHQVCHTKPLPNTPEHIPPELPTPDTATISGSHKRATTNHLTFTHHHTHQPRNPQQRAQQLPTKTAPAKRKKDNIHTQPRNVRFLKSQNFYTKCLPHTLDYPRKTSKIRNNTRPADPEEATQSSTCSSRTPNQPPQHPKKDPAKNSADSQCFLL